MSELSKQALKVDNTTSFPNNTTNYITPSILRAFNVNVIDSVVVEETYQPFTQSVLQSLDALDNFTASLNISFNALNAFTASASASISALNGNTQSVNYSISVLNAFTASQLSINSGYNTFTSSAALSIGKLNDATASLNTFSASTQISITNVNSATASLFTSVNNINATTASLNTSASLGLVTASFNSGTRNLTFTKGDTSTFSVNIPDVSGSTLPSGTISGSAQITALGFVSSSVTASSLVSASFSGNTLTFTKGDASTFGVVIPDVSGSTIPAGTVSSSAQILAYNIFATTGSNTFVGKQIISGTQNGIALTGSESYIDLSGFNSHISMYSGTGSIRFYSGSADGNGTSNVDTWVNLQTNPANGALNISSFPSNNNFVDFDVATTQSIFTARSRFNSNVTVNGLLSQTFGAPTANTQKDLITITGSVIDGKPYNNVNFGILDYPGTGDNYKDVFAIEYYDSTNYLYGSELTLNGKRFDVLQTASGSGRVAGISIRDQYNGTTFASFNADEMQIGELVGGTNTRIGIGHTALPSLQLKAQNIVLSGSISVSSSLSINGSPVVVSSQTGSFITEAETGSFATTGSNTFTGAQRFTQPITASVITFPTGSFGNGINIFQDGLSQIRFYSGSTTTQVGTWVNMQTNPTNGALAISSFPSNNHFVDFDVATTQSIFAAPTRFNNNVSVYGTFNNNTPTASNESQIDFFKLPTFVATNGTTYPNAGLNLQDYASVGIDQNIAIEFANNTFEKYSAVAVGPSKAGFAIGTGTGYDYSVIEVIDNNNNTTSATVKATTVTLQGNIKAVGPVAFTTGSNQQAGTATLNGGNPGTVTVSNSLVTANSIIMVSKQTLNHSNGYVAVSAKSAGSFTITSNHNGDADVVGWFIINNS